jgi:hypothetical protein
MTTPEIIDGRFRHQFTVQVLPKHTLEAVKEFWRTDPGARQTVLRTARARGLHPEGEPTLEGVELVHEGLNTMSVQFTFGVAVRMTYA